MSTTEFKLANVLLEHNDRFFQYPNLYYHSANPITLDEATESSMLLANTSYDFATYFNSFSNKKWFEYTAIDNAWLHLEIKGRARMEFFTLRVQPVGVGMSRLGTLEVDNDEFEAMDWQVPEVKDELVAFRIVTRETTYVRDGYWYTKVDEGKLRDVHLCIATTTFKKEDYIANNVRLFKDEVLGGNDPVAGHASMIVVDNGRTLEPTELEGGGVWVFPNKNVGGSGGFARGMMEAKRLPVKDPVTHVLIMDDDVSLSSESIKRTYNLLVLVNDKYEEAFVSGAMFSLGDQYVQVEDVGFTNAQGRFGPIKRSRVPMVNYYEIVNNEDDLPLRENKYAAFWYCAIPMVTVEREGLPLPLFIRYDDAEYGQRCKPEFMTMNGINIWHEDFADRYNAYYERYCGVRNSLVIQAASGVCPGIDFFGELFRKNFVQEIKKFNYGSCELMLDAVEDFLKGPEFMEVEQCERLLKEKSAKAEKFVPLEKLNVRGVGIDQARQPIGTIKPWNGRLNRWTNNGQRPVPPFLTSNKVAVIPFNANAYPANRIHFRNRILVVNRLGTMGYYAAKDKRRYRTLMKRYNKLALRYKKERKAVEERFKEAGAYLKSEEFWTKYLELSKYGRSEGEVR